MPRHDHKDLLRFDVHVRLPAATALAPLEVGTFRTSMSLFAHHLRDLSAVHFGLLDLNARNVPITADVRPACSL